MKTMSGGPCLHYDCSNRNSFGYCKTTACINDNYRWEQWNDSQSTTNKTIKIVPSQYQIVKQIDLTKDSIEQIADAVVRKLKTEEGE